MRMYHPDTGHEITVADDETVIDLHKAQGWKFAPEPEAVPGYEPEPVTYEPVAPKRRQSKSRPVPADEAN